MGFKKKKKQQKKPLQMIQTKQKKKKRVNLRSFARNKNRKKKFQFEEGLKLLSIRNISTKTLLICSSDFFFHNIGSNSSNKFFITSDISESSAGYQIFLAFFFFADCQISCKNCSLKRQKEKCK